MFLFRKEPLTLQDRVMEEICLFLLDKQTDACSCQTVKSGRRLIEHLAEILNYGLYYSDSSNNKMLTCKSYSDDNAYEIISVINLCLTQLVEDKMIRFIICGDVTAKYSIVINDRKEWGTNASKLGDNLSDFIIHVCHANIQIDSKLREYVKNKYEKIDIALARKNQKYAWLSKIGYVLRLFKII